MAALRKQEPARTAVRKTRWLPALEQELRSRVGWVDEAVSPFAGQNRHEPAPATIRPDVLQGEKAA